MLNFLFLKNYNIYDVAIWRRNASYIYYNYVSNIIRYPITIGEGFL